MNRIARVVTLTLYLVYFVTAIFQEQLGEYDWQINNIGFINQAIHFVSLQNNIMIEYFYYNCFTIDNFLF